MTINTRIMSTKKRVILFFNRANHFFRFVLFDFFDICNQDEQTSGCCFGKL